MSRDLEAYMKELLAIPKVARMVYVKHFFVIGEIQLQKPAQTTDQLLTDLISPDTEMDFQMAQPGNSLDNLTEHLRKALNNPNNSYYIEKDAYDPTSRPHRQSYANGPKTIDNSMSLSMARDNEASPEPSDPSAMILDLIDSEPAEQEDPFALKF